MKVKILKGLPGSGKSTWAKKFVEENKDWVRVNRDDLRNMRGLYWLPKQEDLISTWEKQSVVDAINQGYNVILDSTNLNEKYIDSLKRFITSYKNCEVQFEIEDRFLDVSPEECIKRDLKRANSVGADVIWGMYEKYINPPQEYKENPALPHCIIVDIDGTLANNVSGRSPFDWQRVGEDKPHTWVCSIVIDYLMGSKGKVIIFSGRDGSCAELTTDWLKSWGIPFDYLYMRPVGNTEKDSIIKRRLFEQHVRGKFFVDYVIDDRDQVVRMWRKELGLNCIQVNFGNF